MSIAYVSAQSGFNNSGATAVNTLALTLGTAVTAGSTICIFAGGVPSSGALTTWTLTDNASNTYTTVGAQFSSFSAFQTVIFYCINTTGSPTVFTLHCNGAGGTVTFPAITLDTFTGVASFNDNGENIQASPVGTGNDAITTGSGSISVTAGDLVWGGTVNLGSTGGDTHGTNFTQAQYNISSYLSEYILSAASTGTTACTWTNATFGNGANNEWQSIGITLHPITTDHFTLSDTLGATTSTAVLASTDKYNLNDTLGAVTIVATAVHSPGHYTLSDTLGAVTLAGTLASTDKFTLSDTLGAVTSTAVLASTDKFTLNATLGATLISAQLIHPSGGAPKVLWPPSDYLADFFCAPNFSYARAKRGKYNTN